MPAYQQMGHHSENLLFDPDLSGFAGAVLSPVNYDESATQAQIDKCRQERPEFDVIFDPQLYYPNTERGVLDQWAYFPSDVETADLSSAEWWEDLVAAIGSTCERLGVNAVCSPVVVPRAFTEAFFAQSVSVSDSLLRQVGNSGIRVLQTALVDLPSLADRARANTLASILSGSATDEVFLVAIGNTEPRRELDQSDEIAGLMRLIRALSQSGMRVTVGFASSDVVLWKAAGAASCSSGKFFNLRRFTSSRFDEPGGGGGQLPYWFEESLLAFLRESDVLRVRAEGMLSETSLANPFSARILEILDQSPGRPWLALAWRQFLYWFADVEQRLARHEVDARDLTKVAEQNWLTLDDADVLMEEPRNDGHWVRPWRRALSEFAR